MRCKYKAFLINGIFRHFSWFFWYRCCNCNYDFRRKRGFSFLNCSRYNGVLQRYYLCSKCAPTIEQASKLILNGCHKSLVPKCPFPLTEI